MALIETTNRGPLVVASTYWGSEVERAGKLLGEALVVSLDADFAGVSSRDKNGIRGRQGETDRPPDRGVGQRIGTSGDVVNGERVFGRQCRMQHDRMAPGNAAGERVTPRSPAAR